MAADPTDPDRPLPGASFTVATARFWRRYAVFSGRASRAEYWWSVLAITLLDIAATLLVVVVATVGAALARAGSAAVAVTNGLVAVLGPLLFLFVLAQIVPSISVSVRRLHDANLSGLLVLLSLIPSVGGLIVLVLNVLPPDPAGRRFDRGAAPRSSGPAPALLPSIPAASPPSSARFDLWPAEDRVPATAPLPAQPDPAGPEDPVRAAWAGQGRVSAVDARLSGQPSWRRIGYLQVERPDGVAVLTTHGLAAAEGAAALGAGAEVYLPSAALAGAGAGAAERWQFALVASVARRIGASGMHLPGELEQHGVLSMAVPVQEAPADWRAPDGAVGVLIGIPLDGVPETVVTPGGEVRLVGVVPLRPEELRRILDGGRDARTAIAGDLHALPAAALASAERPAT